MTPIVKFKKLHPDAVIPQYQTDGAAGMDLVWDGRVSIGDLSITAEEVEQPFLFYPLYGTRWFHTGLAIEIPKGYEGQLRPRSSISGRGLIVPNAPGTIDSDYRGEIMVMLRNITGMSQALRSGDRIAQLVIAPVVRASIQEVSELSETVRSAGGFGSTGR